MEIVAGFVTVDLAATKFTVHKVISADEMYAKVHELVNDCDIFIACAAVADYKPKTYLAKKMKKTAEALTIELVRNKDILKSVAELTKKPFCVGFAAETNNVEENARTKFTKKNLDMLFLNNVSRQDIGFNSDYNEITVFTKSQEFTLAKQAKESLGNLLAQQILTNFS